MIYLTVSGGTPNNVVYGYLWNDSTTQEDRIGLQAGTYTVTISDGGNCGTIRSYVINEPTVISPNASLSNAKCLGRNDGSIVLSTTGGVGGYTYLWSNGTAVGIANSLSPGSYSVTITDSNSCTITKSYTITEPTQLQA